MQALCKLFGHLTVDKSLNLMVVPKETAPESQLLVVGAHDQQPFHFIHMQFCACNRWMCAMKKLSNLPL